MTPARADRRTGRGATSAERGETEAGRRNLLATTARLGAVSAEALAALERTSVASARGRLAAAERAGLTVSWRPVRGVPTLHTVTSRGVRVAGTRGLSPARVSAAGARHAAEAATVAAGLAGAFPDREVLGEPGVRAWERERGRPLAALAEAAHRPDLLLVPGGSYGGRPPELPVAIEVELTVKSPARLAAICRAWARSREVCGVIYLAADPVRAPLARAIAEAGAADRIAALALDAFGSAIAGAP